MLKAKLIAGLLVITGFLTALYKAFRFGQKTEQDEAAKAESTQLHDFIDKRTEAEKEANELVEKAESRGDDDRRDVNY